MPNILSKFIDGIVLHMLHTANTYRTVDVSVQHAYILYKLSKFR